MGRGGQDSQNVNYGERDPDLRGDICAQGQSGNQKAALGSRAVLGAKRSMVEGVERKGLHLRNSRGVLGAWPGFW